MSGHIGYNKLGRILGCCRVRQKTDVMRRVLHREMYHYPDCTDLRPAKPSARLPLNSEQACCKHAHSPYFVASFLLESQDQGQNRDE